MSWFFASSATFQNGNSETVNNSPVNLDIVDSYAITTATPEGTTELLFAIEFPIAAAATTLYLYYANEAARDADFVLLEAQVALPVTIKAGWHTAAGFTNGSGQAITNQNYNLDALASYKKTTAKPPFTSDLLFAIALTFSNKNKPEYLYYSSEGNRDADYTTIQNAIAAVSNTTSSTLVLTPYFASILDTTSGAWVLRNLGVGANKIVQIMIERTSGGAVSWVGAREVGSSEPYFPMYYYYIPFFKLIKTDSNGNIEILANSNTSFSITHILSIE